MNFKLILLSVTLVFGLMPNNLISIQKPAFLSNWFSGSKLSEMVQKTGSKAFEWAQNHKLALLSAASAITGGILAYKYFWKSPNNEQIKAQIKKETFDQLISYEKEMMISKDNFEKKSREIKKTFEELMKVENTESNSLEIDEERDKKAKIISFEIKTNNSFDPREIIKPKTLRRKSKSDHKTDYTLTLKPLIDRSSRDLLGVKAEYLYDCDKSKETVEMLFAIPAEN